MGGTGRAFEDAETRMGVLRDAGHAVSARYDRRTARIVVLLNTGVQLAFPARLAEGLAGALAENLAEIEISPAGLGLHWPRLDADVYIPALLQGVLGSKTWMARELGANGGRGRRLRWRRERRAQRWEAKVAGGGVVKLWVRYASLRLTLAGFTGLER